MSKKPKVIIRRAMKKNGGAAEVPLPNHSEVDNPSPVTAIDDSIPDAIPSNAIETVVNVDKSDGMNSSPPGWPSLPGFQVTGGRNHQYFMRSAVILSDCCVQKDWWDVVDVLGRNFESTGFLAWWLRKIGKGHLVGFVKNKDIVDAVRKVAYELHRELRVEIGRPIARW